MDKLSKSVSTNITFSAGESPSPAKLTAITAQLGRVASQLESAVGDIHGEHAVTLSREKRKIGSPAVKITAEE